MSFQTAIQDDVRAIGAGIHHMFTDEKKQLVLYVSHGASAVTHLIQQAVPGAGAALIQFVQDAALDAVKAAENEPGGGQAKMAAALKAFEADIATKGVVLIETAMRFLLENAVLIFKFASA